MVPANITVTGHDQLTVRIEDQPAEPAADSQVNSGQPTRQSFELKTVEIPAGRFVMGASEGDIDALANESPRRAIEFSEPFRMSAHEITVGQFRQFVEAMGYRTEAEISGKGGWKATQATSIGIQNPEFNWSNPGYPVTDSHPVTMVTYADAMAFCDWLSRRDDGLYRLPTEAEWEYACRAGTTEPYHFAVEARDAYSWSLWNVKDTVEPRPVGTRQPNAWGLFDMSGNVREWCLDWYSEDAYRQDYTESPAGPAEGTMRSVRGGCFMDLDVFLRCSHRGFVEPRLALNTQGFRVVKAWMRVAKETSEATSNSVLERKPSVSPEMSTPPKLTTAPTLLAAPFSTADIRTARQGWSKYLGLPETITIGASRNQSCELELVLISPGTFEMGMPETLSLMTGNKAEWAASSKPARRVTITRPFYFSRYEVTQKQFRDVIGGGKTPVDGDGTQHPATQIGWQACVEFCERLTASGENMPKGGKLRLPTEAEWEYACRAGTTSRFWSGDQIGSNQASLRISGREMKLEPVGAFQPNPFGLHNMHGNVAEWCSDWFSPDSYASSDKVDPKGLANGSHKVIRGGGYSNPPFSATSYWRQSYEPGTRSGNIGFRPVLELPAR